MRTHTFEIRAQRPFTKGVSFLAAYAWNHEKRQEWFDDLAQYQVFTSGGEDGWEWRPTDSPVHRLTAAVTWQLPIGRERAFLSDLPAPLDARDRRLAVHGGRALLLGPAAVVQPELRRGRRSDARRARRAIAGSTRAQFRGLQDSFTPRSNPWYLRRPRSVPACSSTDMTLTKMFTSDAEVPRRGAHRGLQRVQQHRLGQSGAERGEPELRQGHAEADRRHRPRDADRRAVHLLSWRIGA